LYAKSGKQRERIPLLVVVKSIEALAAFLGFDRQGRYRPRVKALDRATSISAN
jgi:hypothetical protein